MATRRGRGGASHLLWLWRWGHRAALRGQVLEFGSRSRSRTQSLSVPDLDPQISIKGNPALLGNVLVTPLEFLHPEAPIAGVTRIGSVSSIPWSPTGGLPRDWWTPNPSVVATYNPGPWSQLRTPSVAPADAAVGASTTASTGSQISHVPAQNPQRKESDM